MANGTPEYSTLKPETNSDSDSIKSNGVRFNSAKHDTTQTKIIGNKIKKTEEKDGQVICNNINETKKTLIDKVISYEIIWATERTAAKTAYFEFDDTETLKGI